MLPSYRGIIVGHIFLDPYKPTRIQWNVIRALNVAQFMFQYVSSTNLFSRGVIEANVLQKESWKEWPPIKHTWIGRAIF